MSPIAPLRVLVAGGGFAAAEAVLALRAYAGERVEIELVTPERELAFRPAATGASFGAGPVERFALAGLASDAGATVRRDRLEAVASGAHRVRLASGAHRDYDALVLALGARPRAAVAGAVTFRDQRDAAQLDGVLDELRAGTLDRLALAVPPGVTWALPVYELALHAAAEVWVRGLSTEIALVTPERRPLEVFGAPVSAYVAGVLADADIRFVPAAIPRAVDGRGLRLADGATIAADRVVAGPALLGRRVAGIPGGFGGFVRTGAHGAVDGVADVYAAGDMTSFPVKHGGLAAEQADAISAWLARRAGETVTMPPLTTRLRAELFGAPDPVFLEATLDPDGRPVAGTSHVRLQADRGPHDTLAARHLRGWLDRRVVAAA